MSGGWAVELRVETTLAALGPAWDELFAAGAGLQTSRAWFAATAEAALAPGAEARFLAVEGGDGPLALFAMAVGPGARWGSLTTPYTCLYQPLFRPGASTERLRQAATAFALHCRRWPMTRLEALDPGWSGLPILQAGFAAAGLAQRSFAHFANWHATAPAGGWEAYLASRPGALRETIRRKMRAIERAGDVQIEIAQSQPQLAEALAAYEDVYARSWKEKEPFPLFNTALASALADAGTLRIAVMRQAGRPIAAQYWTVVGGCATVLKLAHDDAMKALSPGTVLTAAAIKNMIETHGVVDLDFGRGDDPYKRAWTGQRRMRIGVLGLNLRTLSGLAATVRHDAGHVLGIGRGHWRRLRSRPGSNSLPAEDTPRLTVR